MRLEKRPDEITDGGLRDGLSLMVRTHPTFVSDKYILHTVLIKIPVELAGPKVKVGLKMCIKLTSNAFLRPVLACLQPYWSPDPGHCER